MYNSFFGFSESPFENKLDQKFIYLGEDHEEVLAAFLYFIAKEKGFAVLCGDVGTGKTMMINSLLNMLSNNVKTIIISNPNVMYSDLLQYIAKNLQLTFCLIQVWKTYGSFLIYRHRIISSSKSCLWDNMN
jgi:general secretion pathway protein A